ncbi:hypothetical protein BH20VER3_BH20VER3_00060 [soil metagenome]
MYSAIITGRDLICDCEQRRCHERRLVPGCVDDSKLISEHRLAVFVEADSSPTFLSCFVHDEHATVLIMIGQNL